MAVFVSYEGEGVLRKLAEHVGLVDCVDLAGGYAFDAGLTGRLPEEEILVAKVVACLDVSDVVLDGLGCPLDLPVLAVDGKFHGCLELDDGFQLESSFSYDVEHFGWLPNIINKITSLE